MADNSKLNDMVDHLINQKPEQAQVDFHGYIKGKMKEVVSGQKDNESDKDNEEH